MSQSISFESPSRSGGEPTVTSASESELHLMGDCPACGRIVVADATCVRYRSRWYHVRCAVEHERAAA